jgi:hypothetical protein
MTSKESPSPETYAVKHAFTRMVRPQRPGAFFAEKYPIEHFRVWLEGTVDSDDNYSKGASVTVEHLYASDGHAVGSVVTAIARANDSNTEHTSLGHGPYFPPLSLEMENEVPSDERTLETIRSIAALAIEAQAILSEGQ